MWARRATTDATRRYTLTGLGPHNWPLHFGVLRHASQWSGVAPSRLLAFVTAYDAVTGDVLASAAGPGNGYALRVLGPMTIRIRVDTGRTSGWHRNAADFAHASVVLLPPSGTKTVDLQIS